MARRIAAVAALCALALGIPASVASAHEGNPDYESIVRGVTPAIAGFSVEVLNGDDRLGVQNTGRSTVTIEGYNDEPYIRMSPGGRVEVNLRSPAHYLNQDRFYGTKVPASAKAGATPRWRTVARTGRYEFHDHRMHWMAKRVPEQVTDRTKRTKLFDWQVPLQAQGTTAAITGELAWRGTGSGPPIGAFVAFGALVILGGTAVVVVRRRRRIAAAGGGEVGRPAGDAGGSPPVAPREEAW